METDWSDIASLCHRRSVLLERNDRDWRPAIDDLEPIEHRNHCWLGTNYDDCPNVKEIRLKGCDCGATKEAIQKRLQERSLG